MLGRLAWRIVVKILFRLLIVSRGAYCDGFCHKLTKDSNNEELFSVDKQLIKISLIYLPNLLVEK
jgi:hypothetical protein